MTKIEIPEALWEIQIYTRYGSGVAAEEYIAELRFCDAMLYTERYAWDENSGVFERAHDYSLEGAEEFVRDNFKSKCAFKMLQVFNSWGGPVR